MDHQAFLTDLARDGDSRVGELFGYHTVADDWRVEHPDGLGEHLIYLVVSGECIGHADGATVRLGPGDAMWLSPGVGFGLESADSPPSLYRFRLRAGDRADPAGIVVVPHAWELRSPFDALVAELEGRLAWRSERIRALLVLVFSTLLRLASHGPGHAPLSTQQRTRLEEWIDARLAERPSVTDLASVVQLSHDYFVRRFRQTYGLPPKSWLVHRRMSAAALRLDESDDPITLVARQLGYPDVYLFSRQFKNVFGVSPRAWRVRR